MSHPTPLSVGNVSDDDAQVIESRMVERDNPPPIVPSTPPAEVYPSPHERPEFTLLLTGYILLSNAADTPPYMVPVDRRRYNLQICADTDSADDGIWWADDPAKLAMPGGVTIPPGAAILKAIHGWVPLNNHTGYLWVSAVGMSAAVGFSWVSVAR